MADEGNERRLGRMDLNLYLGPPRSPRPRSSDLGSDLALSSLPLSTSSTTEESRASLEMFRTREPLISSHAPYSPSHASFTPEPGRAIDPAGSADGNFNQEYTTPYSPSYEPYDPISLESEEPVDTDSPQLDAYPLPALQETEDLPPYSPSYIPLDTQEPNDDAPLVSPLRTISPLISPFPPSMLPDVPMYAPEIPSYVPRSPSYSLGSPPYPPSDGAEQLGRDDESSSRREIFDSPQYQFRRLIESSHRLRLRRFRPSLPYQNSERFDWSTLPIPEQQPVHDIVGSQQSLDTNGKHKVPPEGIAGEGSREENEEKSNVAANFECNICFDMAEDPVVTSCGHLFCWPCLYQWLHVHSEHRECPVCKGEVTDSNITPIYGRGNSEASYGKKPVEGRESNVKIPPRPHGNRFESLRQQFRPISRRFGEGFATSWRRLVNQQMRARSRFEGHGDASLFNSVNHAVWTRLRARRQLRDELNAEIGPEAEEIMLPRDNAAIPQSNNIDLRVRNGIVWHRDRESATNPLNSDISPPLQDEIGFWSPHRDSSIMARSNAHPLLHEGIEPWHWPRDGSSVSRISGTDLLYRGRPEFSDQLNVYGIYANADYARIVGNGSNRYGASTSSVNPSSPELPIPRGNVASASAADQVSASSTTAVIQGDVAIPEGSAELNTAGSSRSYRRRGRTSAFSSLDVDGVLRECKRRRLN